MPKQSSIELMKQTLITLTFLILSQVASYGQFEVKLNPHRTASPSNNGLISTEFIRSDSTSLELILTGGSSERFGPEGYVNLALLFKKYKNPNLGADGWYFSPFARVVYQQR